MAMGFQYSLLGTLAAVLEAYDLYWVSSVCLMGSYLSRHMLDDNKQGRDSLLLCQQLVDSNWQSDKVTTAFVAGLCVCLDAMRAIVLQDDWSLHLQSVCIVCIKETV